VSTCTRNSTTKITRTLSVALRIEFCAVYKLIFTQIKVPPRAELFCAETPGPASSAE
jgi:hypothetical protein